MVTLPRWLANCQSWLLNPIIVMNIVDFEAMETFIVTDDINAWDAE